ncbi:MAG: tryptophan 7-halogenase [Calditrichia bacterium]
MPYCYFTLNRIGMVEKLRKTHFTKKYSVQFASTRGNISQPFYFGEHLDHAAAQTWQVRRSEFDKMLLDNAREKGANVFEGWRVREALENDGAITGIIAQDENDNRNEFIAPVTIDASGRNSFFVNRNGWRVMDEQLKKVSIWTYYKGAKRDAGIDEGATTVAYIPEKGWFWYIPLADDGERWRCGGKIVSLSRNARSAGNFSARNPKQSLDCRLPAPGTIRGILGDRRLIPIDP